MKGKERQCALRGERCSKEQSAGDVGKLGMSKEGSAPNKGKSTAKGSKESSKRKGNCE